MSVASFEYWGAVLLVAPAGYSFARLCLARWTEYQAGRMPAGPDRDTKAGEARVLASGASLFPVWVLIPLGLGLILQIGVLIAKFLGYGA